MMKNLYFALPHLLFIVLIGFILSPHINGTEPFGIFLGVVIAVELALLANRHSIAARNIVTIIYIFLLIWEYTTAHIGVKNAMLYPAPENVFQVFMNDYELILTGIGSSLRLLFASFGMAIFLGVLLGLSVGLSDRLSGTLLPIVRVISPIPPIIYSPYAVALLPSFRIASIFIVTLTMFWPIFMNMIMSVREVDSKIMDSARTLNLSKRDMIFNILIPYSLPSVINNSISVSVSTSFLVLTAAEMLGGTSGLGWFIKYYSDFADFDRVIAGIIMIGVVVTLLNVLISFMRRRLIHWR